MRSWLRERKGENIMKQYYKMKVAGCDRELPLCPVNEHLDIAAFIMFGDIEVTEKAAKLLLEKCPEHDVAGDRRSEGDSALL